MSPKFKWIGLVVVVGLTLVFCIVFASPREELHKGKPVNCWVDRACVGYDANGVRELRREVKYIGPSAVPLLIRKLRASDGWGRSRPYLWLRANVPTRWQHLFPDVRSAEENRYGAIRTLETIGPVAKPAVGDLVRLLPKITDPIIGALKEIGPGAKEALPALHALVTNQIIVIHDTNHYLRVQIAGALWSINRETNDVLDICTNAMVPGVD